MLLSWKAPEVAPGDLAENARKDGAAYPAPVVILVPAVTREIPRVRRVRWLRGRRDCHVTAMQPHVHGTRAYFQSSFPPCLLWRSEQRCVCEGEAGLLLSVSPVRKQNLGPVMCSRWPRNVQDFRSWKVPGPDEQGQRWVTGGGGLRCLCHSHTSHGRSSTALRAASSGLSPLAPIWPSDETRAPCQSLSTVSRHVGGR